MNNARKIKISREEILRHISYDPITGIIMLKNPRYHNTGPREIKAGAYGYIQFNINKRTYLGHRVAWFLVYGTQPVLIDHINGIKHDNRICNLRSVTTRINNQNKKIHRKGRLLGATYEEDRRKWKAQIKISGKKWHLGYFETEQEAHAAYMKAYDKIKQEDK